MLITYSYTRIKLSVKATTMTNASTPAADDLQKRFAHNNPFLMEGAIGTRLSGEYGLSADTSLALAVHVYTEPGRAALGDIYTQYIAVAGAYGLPFLANTPTRRVNRERALSSPYGESAIADNVAFLRSLAPSGTAPVFVGATLGCKGNAYTGEGCLPEEEALRFHAWSVERFVRADADYLFAGLMPTLPEAIGLAKACAATSTPYIISFTLRSDGRLVDGTILAEAIRRIDAAVDRPPLGYMTNCIHSALLAEGLSRPYNNDAAIRDRFLGIQANASRLPADKLDGSATVFTSDPQDLAAETAKLRQWFEPKILGGCCGTDTASLAALAGLLCGKGEGRI